jgi:outer membrane protein TolC
MKGKAGIGLLAALVLAGCAVDPERMTWQDQAYFAQDRLQRVTADQEPVTHAISLYEAMARAIKYNLDIRVEAMEAALRIQEIDLSRYDLLPRLVASSGYMGRDKPDGSSTSSADTSYVNADITFSWNILDFGLSYVRAKQAADKYLMQEEMKRKIVNRTIEDVRTAYWRAVSYDRLISRMRALEGRVQQALSDTRSLASNGSTSPIAALSYERELLQIRRELEQLENQLRIAKSQLAALMNVPPDQNFALVIPERRPLNMSLSSNYHKLYMTALSNRPEMHELAYQMRINDRELDASLLQLLPGLQLYAGANYDSNDFLNDASWISWGAKASWNLLRAFSIPATHRKIDAQAQMLDTKSLSVAMAIMTQVHVSRARFLQARKEYKTAQELATVQNKLLKQIRNETAAQRTSEQILIREEMNALVTDSKLDMVYADLQNAYGNAYASLGLDPFPDGLSASMGVSQMSRVLSDMWLERGADPTLALN